MNKLLIFFFLILSFSSRSQTLDSFYLDTSDRVLFMGENHKDDLRRDLFKESLRKFKSSGGDTLGLEMIESHKQFLLDNYLSFKDNSHEELSDYLTVRWQYNTNSYMSLISKARDLGFRLLAIDLKKRSWPKETGLYPIPPDSSKVRAAREDHMAKIICAANFQRIVVIIGSFHSMSRFLPNQLINECSMSSSSLVLSSLYTLGKSK